VTTPDQGKALVLSRVRAALGVAASDRAREASVKMRLRLHPRGTIPARALQNREACLALLIEMLAAQGADSVRTPSPEATVRVIADYLASRNLPPSLRMSVEPVLAALPWSLAPQITRSHGVAEPSDTASLTRALVAVAETGTLVLVSGLGSPTTLNFLPESQIVLLSAGDIVGSYEEAWDRLRALYGGRTLPRTVNWISGPSRTADIEQTIIRGAHGPKRLLVVIQDSKEDRQT
jgi:L-lactate dehydrogenase complex protein LldG